VFSPSIGLAPQYHGVFRMDKIPTVIAQWEELITNKQATYSGNIEIVGDGTRKREAGGARVQAVGIVCLSGSSKTCSAVYHIQGSPCRLAITDETCAYGIPWHVNITQERLDNVVQARQGIHPLPVSIGLILNRLRTASIRNSRIYMDLTECAHQSTTPLSRMSW